MPVLGLDRDDRRIERLTEAADATGAVLTVDSLRHLLAELDQTN